MSDAQKLAEKVRKSVDVFFDGEEKVYFDSLVRLADTLQEERDDARANALLQATAATQGLWRDQKARAEAAEAERDKLREALFGLLAYVPESGASLRAGYGKARQAALVAASGGTDG